MAYEKQIEDFAESKATWISSSDLPLLHTKQLVRCWKAVTDTEKATNEAYLNAYVSPKNVTPSTTITDPQADGCGTLTGGAPKNVFSGLWRHVSTNWDRQNQVYVQTLRLGWASTVLSGSDPNDECMIRTGEDTREDSRTYVFYWRNIAETAVHACVASLRALGSFTDPSVQGETKSGTYAFSSVVPEQTEDGSYIIRVTAIEVAAIAGASDLDSLYPVKRFLHVVENPFGLEGRYTEHLGRKPTDGIVYTYRALSKDSEAAIRAITDAEYQLRLDAGDKLKFEFVKADLVEDSGNTLKLELTYQYVPLATSTPEASARLVGEVRFNQSGKLVLTRSWPRIDPDYAEALLKVNDNPKVTDDVVTDPMAEGSTYSGDWIVIRTRSEMTDNDGLRIVQELLKSGDQQLFIKVGTDPLHLLCEFKLWDASVEAVEAFLADSDPFGDGSVDPKWNTPELGILKVVRTQASAQDRSIDLHATYSTSDNLDRVDLTPGGSQGPVTIRDMYGVATERGFGFNVPVSELLTYSDYYNPVVDVVNVKREFTVTRRDEHTFDFVGALVTYTTIDHGVVVLEDSDDKYVTLRTGDYVLPADLADDQVFGRPTGGDPDGTLTEIESKPNDVGTYSVAKKVTVTRDQVASSTTREGTVKTTTVEQHSAGAEVSAGAATVNRRSEAVNEPRADGLHTTKKTDMELNPVSVASGLRTKSDAFADVDTSIQLNQTTVTAAENNEKLDVQHNGLGGLDVRRDKTTEKDAQGSRGLRTVAVSTDVETHTARASELTPGSASIGTKIETENKPTPGGNFESSKATSTFAELDVDIAERKGTYSDMTGTVRTHGATALTGDAPAQNVIQVVDFVRDPNLGTFEGKKTTETLRSVDSGAFVHEDNGLVERTSQLLFNQTSVPDATTNERVDAKSNGAGGWDIVKVKKALKAGLSVKTWSQRSTVDWSPMSFKDRFPKYSVSTNPSRTHQTGWNVYLFSINRPRTITTTITREFSLGSPPSVATVPAAVPVGDGAFTSTARDVLQVGGDPELWCVQETTESASEWGTPVIRADFLYYVTLDA